ncbi:hypothetical protein E2R51_01835 [Jeotgalibacillus sp. S-D1]|uniref:helix-hairpin-helix domain-containing protein n=1 Tax=Jeotgalibacillus sp. S-D1 TaxID=2552189 RepID=UPI001059CDBD|nr:helix-hairpin-helix domain-containing protein [Jeotgalibacillus sp. S-D1]TDL34480.1 hypothetical protein E2R51_01835 [Jeotgalibacillus sp. S-D1]
MKQWLQLNRRILLISCPLLLVFFLLFNPFKSASTEIPTPLAPVAEPISQSEESEPLPIETSPQIQVDIKGKVQSPGVYTVADGDRVIDLIKLAGGETAEADMREVNLSQKLYDEMVIYIPAEGEEVKAPATQPGAAAAPGQKVKVNLNSADSDMLQTIPGIGPSKAEAILDYRDTVGRFETIEDIKNISGIGDKTFDKLKESIDVK